MSDPGSDLSALIFDAVDAGLAVLDRNSRVQAWNVCMASLTGVHASSALGKTLEDALSAALPLRLSMSIHQAIELGASSMLSHTLHPSLLPLPPRQGRPVIHNITVSPIGPAGTSCLLQVADVTTTALRERVLRERQNARYDAVVDSAPDAIVTVNAEGIIQWVN